MPCIYGDQPLRIKLTEKGVTHAGAYYDYGGFNRTKYDPTSGVARTREYVPKQKRVRMVCRWRGVPENLDEYVVSNKNKITCKQCQKLMGLTETPLATDRFVVRKKSTGEFGKNTSTRCTPWSDSLNDAFFYKRRHTAEDKCKMYRYEVDGKLITYGEWAAAGRPKHSLRRVSNPDLEVKTVKIRLE